MELFATVEAYIKRERSLRYLETWLTPRLAHYLTNPNSPVGNLATAIELGLAEMSAGITDEPGIRRALAKHLAPNPVQVIQMFAVEHPSLASASNTTTHRTIPVGTGLAPGRPQIILHSEPLGAAS